MERCGGIVWRAVREDEEFSCVCLEEDADY